jgi:hypothetical protein
MSHILPHIHPKDLPADCMTMQDGDYYYRARNGKLYMIRALDDEYIPLEIIVIEYPTLMIEIKSLSNETQDMGPKTKFPSNRIIKEDETK